MENPDMPAPGVTAPSDSSALPLVLIIEDDADLTQLLLMALRRDYRLENARDGYEGLAKALELRPDLILSDLAMPGLAGVNLVRELRSHRDLASVPIVALTALKDAELRAEILRNGAQDYVTKPFASDELRARLAHHISVYRARQALRAEALSGLGEGENGLPAELAFPAQDLAVLARDVASRKRALETSLEVLRQSRALFHLMARESAHASGVFFDLDLRFTIQQGEGLDALGAVARDIAGKAATEGFSEELSTLIIPHMRAALHGAATTFEVSLEMDHSAGEGRVYLMRALPVRDDDGDITGGLLLAQDLRDHRLEEDEWQGFQAKILAQVEDAVNVIDPRHRVLYWNDGAARLYGLEAAEALGRPLDEIYDYEWLNEGGREAVIAELDRVGWWQGECLHRLKHDGREILVDVSLSLMHEPGGGLTGFLAVIRDITARKRAEEVRARLEGERDELLLRLQQEFKETRRLQQRLHLQFERMPVGAIVWDEDFRVQSWNPAATTIFGFSTEEVMGHHAFKSIVPPETRPQVDAIWQRLLTGDTTAHSINENITRDEKRIICQWSNTPLQEADGRIVGVLSMVHDITDRVYAEEALRESEERLSGIVNSAMDAIISINEAQTIQVFNPAAEKMFGYSSDEVLECSIDQLISPHEGSESHISKDFWQKRLIAQEMGALGTLYGVRANGEEFPIEASIAEMQQDGHKIFTVILRDITARRREEHAQHLLAKASESLNLSLDYASTLETIAQLCVPALAEMCVIDLVGRGVGVAWPEEEEDSVRRVITRHADPSKDEVMHALLNYSPHFQAGSLLEKVVARKRPVFIERLDEETLNAAIHDKDHRALLKELAIQSCVLAPLVAHGLVIGMVSLCNSDARKPFSEHDRSLIEELMRRAALALENSHLYGQAQKAQQEAEAANRAKDEFLAVVSHELRTPLTPILGWVSMLMDEERNQRLDAATREHALEAIQQAAEQQAQLIDDLLDVSRIISGTTRLHSQPMHLRPVVEAALNSARPAARKKNINLWTAFDPEMGMIEGDARRLQQIVANLISNAIKFTPPCGRIEVQLAEYSGRARLEVRDTGIGIEPEFLPRVFDRFSQSDASTSRLHGGLGLGLSIVRHLAELHGGIVEAASEGTDHGAVFTVSFPLLPRSVQGTSSHSDYGSTSLPLPGSAERILSAIPATALTGRRLLVVDDEPATRDMLARVLGFAGAEVQTAESAASARQILARWKPDVLVSDIGMPDEDGYAFIRFVRSLHPVDGGTLPAIALTAYTRGADRDDALAAGYQKHVPKPVTPADLIALIAELTPQNT